MDVHVSHTICEGERAYTVKRKEVALKCLESHGINCSEGNVPHIAVLGSGGGEKAMLGLLGSLYQMGQENLLDCALYLCGVSGSTWCMSSLYKEPQWAIDLEKVKDEVVKRLALESVTRTAVLDRLKDAIKDENFSLTDVWAAFVADIFLHEMDTNCLSQQGKRDATNPYPIYTATDMDLRHTKPNTSWFEFTPHESGYSVIGAFTDTSLVRSEFEKGKLKKQTKEMDMLYLQALCGSAPADMEDVMNAIWDWLKVHRDCEDCAVLYIILQQYECCEKDEEGFYYLQALREKLNTETEEPAGTHLKGLRVNVMDQSTWLSTDKKGRESHLTEILEKIYLVDEIEETCEIMVIAARITWCIITWTWGTTNNFLYNYPAKDGEIPSEMLSEENRYLADAGPLWNSPYVAALRPERKVDLLLSFDFSDGDPFLTLTNAKKYCTEQNIPFPAVEIQDDKDHPKDFYLFEGKRNTPTVIHIPLFNICNCDDVPAYRNKYKTLQGAYSREMLDELIEMAGKNVSSNKAGILEAIKNCCSAARP